MNAWLLTRHDNKVVGAKLYNHTCKFAKSGYWHCWSRNIGKHSRVDITSIPSCFTSTWEDVEKIRLFSQQFCGKDDIQSDTLPLEVHLEMLQNLGPELTEKLVCYDFLSEISEEDIERANKRNVKGGGVTLQQVRESNYVRCPTS